MTVISASNVLLDIEGTTSSVSFVYDVLFPYAKKLLPDFIRENWNVPQVKEICTRLLCVNDDIEVGVGISKNDHLRTSELQIEFVLAVLERMMEADSKATELKSLQGMIWAQGYENGHLQSHVYEDFPPSLREWFAAGLDVRIFSSGSVQAQKVFFANTEYGDLTRYFSAHYDTMSGSKKDVDTYRYIASQCMSKNSNIDDLQNHDISSIVFFSDVIGELDAARTAGMNTVLVDRDGSFVNPPEQHLMIHSFSSIEIKARA